MVLYIAPIPPNQCYIWRLPPVSTDFLDRLPPRPSEKGLTARASDENTRVIDEGILNKKHFLCEITA